MTRFMELLKNINCSHVFIQTHNFPDPDAIASAYGLKKLLKINDISSTICYKGRIDRCSTLEMVRLLDIDIVDIDNLPALETTDEIILIDSQKGNANVISTKGTEIICIDHHPTFEEVTYRYADIRSSVGACASIIADYYYENGVEIDVSTATALLYGIKVDTANLTRAVSSLDLEMFYRLFYRADADILRKIEMNTLNLTDLRAYANAINSIEIYRDIGFANTGNNCPEALIANICDFMLAISEVNFCVVYSIKPDGIKLSVRSKDTSMYNAGKLTNEALKSIGSGGGHSSMAGGFVKMEGDMDTKGLIETIEERFISLTGDVS